MTNGPPLIYLIAGEPSGDAIGGRLIDALAERTGEKVRFAGVGGPRMAARGLDSLFPMDDLTLFGAAEVLPKVPRILRRVRETVADIRATKPDAVVSIDVPGFAFRVQKRLKDNPALRIHYVAPTVWAYRPGRARAIAGFLDHLLVLLPFEPPYFEREGLPSTFVGHPVVEEGARDGDGARYRTAHGIGEDRRVLCILPGSRRGEIDTLLPIFGEVLERLAPQFPDLHLAVPTVPHVEAAVRAAAAGWPLPATVTLDAAEKYDAFAASRAALAASGTVSLELTLAGVPMVVAYRLNALTALWLRPQLRVSYASLVNILLDRPTVPEFLQDRCRAEEIAPALTELLEGGPERDAQLAGLAEGAAAFGPGGDAPSMRAADTILNLIEERRR
ncbi:MAG: lipid-A-disaccharide synthase [Rhodospirillaceae bacterium]|nr:lipid-A-disaccharide synthase [Rhodospirillaceae bacterium]